MDEPRLEPNLEFEAALNELEQIVDELERGESALAQTLSRYERGVRLLAHCHGLLEGAERTVALLSGVDPDGQPQTAPFDATATVDRTRPRPDDGIPF
jgi:exodeoxyribonuclease VII small subunit